MRQKNGSFIRWQKSDRTSHWRAILLHVSWMARECEMCHLLLRLYQHSSPEGCNNNLSVLHCSQLCHGTNMKDAREGAQGDNKKRLSHVTLNLNEWGPNSQVKRKRTAVMTTKRLKKKRHKFVNKCLWGMRLRVSLWDCWQFWKENCSFWPPWLYKDKVTHHADPCWHDLIWKESLFYVFITHRVLAQA